MKHHVVLFGEHGARIITCDDTALDHFRGMPNVAIDPDLSEVKGIPPHNWKLDGSNVVVGSPTASTPTITTHKISVPKSHYLKIAAAMLLTSLAVHLILHSLGF